MQIAEFLTARTMGLCLVFQSMPSPLFLLLLLHLDSCLCWCSLEKSVPTVLTAPWEVITSSSGSKLHSHKVSSFLHPLLYLFIYLFVCLFGLRRGTQALYGGQKTVCGDRVSPSTMWILGLEPRSPAGLMSSTFTHGTTGLHLCAILRQAH